MVRIIEKATKKMREIMISRGHVEGQKMELLAKFYILLTVIFIFNTILDICNLEAHQLEEKIFRFKNINMLICGLAYPLVDSDTYSLISHAEDPGNHRTSSQRSSEAWTTLNENLNRELDLMNKALYSVVVSSVVTLTFGPLVAAILKYYPKILAGALHEIDVTELTLPINFLYPEEYANLATYIFLYALQTLYMYLFAGYMYCTLTSGLMAMKMTIHDMKVLCQTVKEWDMGRDEIGGKNQSYEILSSPTKLTDTKFLKRSLVNAIKIHELTCRRASNLNRNLEIMYTILNNTICFQICVCLYSAAKMDDFVLKIEHIVLVLPMASILFLYCFCAQQLLNEGENFRKTLWESAFFDKPKWYKSSFLMIMIRNTKDLEIKPFGFYVLNLKTFAMVMNAAYSYFNMLNSFNKRI